MNLRLPSLRRFAALRWSATAGMAAVCSFWLAGGFRGESGAPSITGDTSTSAGSAMAVPLPPWSLQSGSQSTLQLVRSLRTASSPVALREAFLSTRDYGLRCAITARWAALDPGGCFQTLCASLDQTPSDIGLLWGAFPLLFQQWAAVDPAAARTALRERKEVTELSLGPFIQTCARLGGEAWTGFLHDPAFRMVSPPVASQPLIGLSPPAPENAIRLLTETAQQGLYGLLQLQTVWLETRGGDPLQALAAWRNLPASGRRLFTSKVIDGLMTENPAQGAAFMAELTPQEREQAGWVYAGRLAEKDAQGAWAWLTTNLHRRQAEAADAWGNEAAPADAVKILAAAPPSPVRDAAAAALADQWMQKEPAAAAAWLMAMEDPAMKRLAWRRAAWTWAQKAPEQAVTAFLAPGAPPLSPDEVTDVTRTLLRMDPALAARFADGLPPLLSAAARKELENDK